jgi:4-carboxymuconolactone decarboxylase
VSFVAFLFLLNCTYGRSRERHLALKLRFDIVIPSTYGGDMRKVPEHFQQFKKKYPRLATAYDSFAAECYKLGPLNERDCSLVRLGIAAGSHMEGAVHSQVRKSLDAGVQPDEIRHAIVLAATTIGFPRMMAALAWAEDILSQENPKANLNT